ncbi:MAG: peptidase M48 Ste24p, partial [Pseudohongiellaceae bacterium]
IQSFRPIARNERMMANPIHIEYIQTDGRVTYADLASTSRLPQYAEDELRLMNGDYPNGEPAAGEWVKIAR